MNAQAVINIDLPSTVPNYRTNVHYVAPEAETREETSNSTSVIVSITLPSVPVVGLAAAQPSVFLSYTILKWIAFTIVRFVGTITPPKGYNDYSTAAELSLSLDNIVCIY